MILAESFFFEDKARGDSPPPPGGPYGVPLFTWDSGQLMSYNLITTFQCWCWAFWIWSISTPLDHVHRFLGILIYWFLCIQRLQLFTAFSAVKLSQILSVRAWWDGRPWLFLWPETSYCGQFHDGSLNDLLLRHNQSRETILTGWWSTSISKNYL